MSLNLDVSERNIYRAIKKCWRDFKEAREGHASSDESPAEETTNEMTDGEVRRTNRSRGKGKGSKAR